MGWVFQPALLKVSKIIASLNSLAANLPVELVIALVKKNVWTPEQGLAYVLQSSNPEQKANLLTKLANCLPITTVLSQTG